MTDEVIGLINNPNELQKILATSPDALTESIKMSYECLNSVDLIFKEHEIAKYKIRETPFQLLLPWIESKTKANDLDDWVNFLRTKEKCRSLGLNDFITKTLESSIKSYELEKTFLKRFWKTWVSKAHEDTPVLNEFQKSHHEDVIKEYCELDKKLKKVSALMTQEKIYDSQPKQRDSQSSQSQLGILLKEFAKKRRHRPLRRLFADITELLQELKPCLLMSPLSVASYLGASRCNFDLIIFDEASQIPPEDAIGSVLRGEQLIVAGDNKQLPPTRFFQTDLDADEYEDLTDDEPLESILDECSTVPQFTQTMLKWHYRSKHEELVSFSNHNFYKGSLITFPSPFSGGSSGAVQFCHVPNGIYDRGKSKTNRIEATKVIDLLTEHLRGNNTGSVGIIALSLAQEETILQEWERRKTVEPDLAALADAHIDEPLFIKALEKVQGDERDYILISIGYGPDSNGTIHMNFGPINRTGGERRLNVAVTRSRYGTSTVCSMFPYQLDLARLTTGNEGVKHLQGYLDYSMKGGKIVEGAYSSGGYPESDFEIAVKEALEAKGFKIDAQVGSSGFRIDLGVRHPDYPNRYILGIECDGATYHSHRAARDRDRLRQEVLMQLGWHIHRIWSTDWIRNPSSTLESVIRKIDDLKIRGPGIPAPTKSPKESFTERNNPGKQNTQNGGKETTQSSNLKLPIYKNYDPPKLRDPEDLYSCYDSRKMETLITDITSVVRKESPIHFELLCTRVCQIYQLKKAGKKIKKTIKNILERMVSNKVILRRGDFILDGNQAEIVPRQPGEGMKPRPITLLSTEELAAAVEWLLKNEYGMPYEDLIRNTAHLMGYQHTGVNVEKHVSKAINYLLKESKAVKSDNQIITCIQPLSATLGFKDLCRSFESETFSRTIIEPGFDLCQMVL